MRLVHIRTRSDEEGDCLLRELSVYAPKRLKRVVLVELGERSQADLLALLAAVETCLAANDIRSVRIEIDGKPYMMTPREAR
jgi:hypothetical protein